MKKFIFLVVTILMAISCGNAQSLSRDNYGKLRIIPEQETLTDLGITLKTGTETYINFFQEAIDNPGTPILVHESERLVKLKLFFKEIVEIEKVFIVYNNEKKVIDLNIASPEPKEQSSIILLSIIISIIAMALSNFFFWLLKIKKTKKKQLVPVAFIVAAAFVFFSAFAVLIIVAAAFNSITFVVIVASVLFVIAFAALMAAIVDTNINVLYKILSIIFYIATVIEIIFLFI